MIERYDHIVQADRERRNLEFVNRRGRYSFQASAQFVPEQAGPAAAKWR